MFWNETDLEDLKGTSVVGLFPLRPVLGQIVSDVLMICRKTRKRRCRARLQRTAPSSYPGAHFTSTLNSAAKR